MATFLIGYDLNRAGQNYPELWDGIKSAGTWWHNLDSTWIIVSSYTATYVRDYLKQFIDSNDELLVIEITGDNWASIGFTQVATDWLKKNI